MNEKFGYFVKIRPAEYNFKAGIDMKYYLYFFN
jgi:hypothetical protein